MFGSIKRFFCDFSAEEFSFKYIGVDMAATDHEPFLKHPVRLVVSYSASIFCSIAVVKFAVKFHSNIDLLAEALTLLVFLLMTLIKYLAFHTNARKFIKLAKILISLGSHVNAEEQEILKAAWKRKQRVNMVFFLMGWLCSVQFMVTPLLLLLHRYHTTGEIVFFPLFPGILPYNDQHPANYVLTFLLEFLFLFHSLSVLVAVDCQFNNFAQHISAHFKIICAKIEGLGSLPAPGFQQRFNQLIIHHDAVLDLVNKLNCIYPPVILTEVVFSVSHLCLEIYRFAYAQNLDGVIFLLLLAVSTYTKLSIYSFGGETIQNESENVSHAIYLNLRWDELPPKMRNLLLLTIIRSQRSKYISGYFFKANRQLLVWVFRMAISLSAVLLALKDEYTS